MVRSIILVFLCAGSMLAQAKCPPLWAMLSVQHSGGGSTSLNLDTILDGGLGLTRIYNPIVLGPGDSLVIQFQGFACWPTNNILWNGSIIHQSGGMNNYGLFKVAQPGYYLAESWDEGADLSQFQITANSGPTGPVLIHGGAFLEGAMDDGEMTSHLFIGAPYSYLENEPYEDLGLTYVSGGGEYFNINGAPYDFWIDPLVDWILVELRDAAQPGTIVCTKSALLMNDGRLLDPITYGDVWLDAPANNYYVAVRHRNHLGAMTAAPLALSATPTTVDFRDPALPTWGTNARVISGNQALLRMGNVHRGNGPQQVKYTGANNDRDPILSRIGGSMPTATTAGYFVEDVNLDGVVKYIGADNDRDLILQSVGGTVPTAVVNEQIPN